MTKEERKLNFLQKAKKIHKNKYDYSKVDYTNANTKVCIICPKHGEFWQTPHHHLEGHGCKLCADILTGISNKMSREDFIDRANLVHDKKYSYDKCIYKNARTNVIITCPVHGDFEQLPCHHLAGHGCPRCSISRGELLVRSILDKNSLNYIELYRVNIDKNINPSGFAYIDFYLPNNNLFIEYNGELHYILREYFGGKLGFIKLLKRDNFVREYSKINGILLLEIPYLIKTEESIINYINKYDKKILVGKEL